MVFSIKPALTIHRWCRHTDAALPPPPCEPVHRGTQIDIFVMAITRCRPVEVRSSVLESRRSIQSYRANKAAARAWRSRSHGHVLELLLHMIFIFSKSKAAA